MSEIRRFAKPGSGIADTSKLFTYESEFNKVNSVTNELGKITNYVYNDQGDIQFVTLPDDVAGNLVSHRLRSGDTVSLSYDDLNRLILRDYPVATATNDVVYKYDLLGRRTQAKYGNNTHLVSFKWDNAGRLLNTISAGKRTAYVYDDNGNQIRTTWPGTGFYVKP